jgi:hypothetical protein
MRLIQIRDAVQRDLQSQRRQTRRHDLEELRRLDSEADSAADPDTRRTLGAKARELAHKYEEDEEFLSGANGLLKKLNLPGIVSKPSSSEQTSAATLSFAAAPPIDPPPQPSPDASLIFAPPVIPPAQQGKPVAAVQPPKVKPSAPAPKKIQPALTPHGSPINPKLIIAIASAAFLLVVGLLFVVFHHKQAPQQPAVVQTSPAPLPVVQPEPVLAALKLSSDAPAGKVSLDGQPPTDLQDAQWSLDKLSPGDHTLKFESPSGTFEVTLTSVPGALPTIKSPIVAKNILAVFVSGMGDHIRVYSSDKVKLSLDGQPQVDVSANGADLTSVAAGPHELTVTQGHEEYKLAVEATPTPALSAFVESGQNVGTLVVVTGQDKTTVFLNGKALSQQTQAGQLRIANLEPKDYIVRVVQPGFQDVAEQHVRIRKGQQARLVFGLLPVPHMAQLIIQGGPVGATVLIDQSSAGTVQSDGTLNLSSVSPGDHTVEIRKDRFKPKQFKKHFVAGTPVTLTAADLALDSAPSELRINYTPADAQVSVFKQGEAPMKAASGTPLSLAPGSYTLAVRMSDGFMRTANVEVSAGQMRTLDLSLAPSGMNKWDGPDPWRQENGVYVRKGGDYILYNLTPTSGTFVFSAMLNKGHRLQWVVNYTDPNNYDLFQIDDNNFYRTDVRNGQKVSDAKIPHKSEKKSFRTLQVRITPTEVVHQIKEGDNWTTLDRWSQPGTNLSSGRFGFYLPGGDQVSLASFGHYLDLNLR